MRNNGEMYYLNKKICITTKFLTGGPLVTSRKLSAGVSLNSVSDYAGNRVMLGTTKLHIQVIHG